MAAEDRQEWVWRDVFRSIGLAFSFSRLVVGWLGLAVMAGVDGVLTWVRAEFMEPGWLSDVVYYVDWALLALIFLYTATAIAYSVKSELLEGEGKTAGASIAFVFKKFWTIFLPPVLIWMYIVLMGFFAFAVYMLGWIPVAGPIIYAALFLFVLLFSVLAGMGVLAFFFSLFLSPAIVAVRQEGALDAVLDTIDLMRGRGAFWVMLLVTAASMLLGGLFLGKTFEMGYRIADRTMGESYKKTVAMMPAEIKPRADTVFSAAKIYWPGQYRQGWGELCSYVGLSPRFIGPTELAAPAGRPGTVHKLSGWILGIWVLILAGFAISFTWGAFVAAGTLTYLIVREEEEFLEPEAVESAPAEKKVDPSEETKAEEKAEEGDRAKNKKD